MVQIVTHIKPIDHQLGVITNDAVAPATPTQGRIYFHFYPHLLVR